MYLCYIFIDNRYVVDILSIINKVAYLEIVTRLKNLLTNYYKLRVKQTSRGLLKVNSF